MNAYTYSVRYNDAISLIKEIEPFLVLPEKKRKAQMIMNDYKKLTVRNGRYNDEQRKAKEAFYEAFMRIG